MRTPPTAISIAHTIKAGRSEAFAHGSSSIAIPLASISLFNMNPDANASPLLRHQIDRRLNRLKNLRGIQDQYHNDGDDQHLEEKAQPLGRYVGLHMDVIGLRRRLKPKLAARRFRPRLLSRAGLSRSHGARPFHGPAHMTPFLYNKGTLYYRTNVLFVKEQKPEESVIPSGSYLVF